MLRKLREVRPSRPHPRLESCTFKGLFNSDQKFVSIPTHAGEEAVEQQLAEGFLQVADEEDSDLEEPDMEDQISRAPSTSSFSVEPVTDDGKAVAKEGSYVYVPRIQDRTISYHGHEGRFREFSADSDMRALGVKPEHAGPAGGCTVHICTVCALLLFQFAVVAAVTGAYFMTNRASTDVAEDLVHAADVHLAHELATNRELKLANELLKDKERKHNEARVALEAENHKLRGESHKLRGENAKLREGSEELRKKSGELHKVNEELTKRYIAFRAHTCKACFAEARRPDKDDLREETLRMKRRLANPIHASRGLPYKALTGLHGHQQPKMYGKVPEKTMWSYWYHPDDCPSSSRCTLPPAIKLCTETMEKNRGRFGYKLMYMDDVEDYVVAGIELPVRWSDLPASQQKHALMNALLARYGGVALDASTVLLRPLDDYWEEMVREGATFRGYMYRINGLAWRHAEVTATWFLMARREGIFNTAVRNQVIGMGDEPTTDAYRHKYLALGDQTITPILTMFNYSWPKCFEDPLVELPASSKRHQFEDQDPDMCPEYEGPVWHAGLSGPPRNDTRILLRDPRDGPQLPFAFYDMVRWNISDDTTRQYEHTNGAPMHDEGCSSMKECWDTVFMRRYHKAAEPGQAPLLSFVKIFKHALELDGKSRDEILAANDTYFYQWLLLAGVID